MNSRESSRRDFLRHAAATAAALATPTFSGAQEATVVPAKGAAETLVKTLYDSLTAPQREVLLFPFTHKLRKEVDNNWHITKPRIGQFLNADQNAMVREIFLNLHSEEYRDEVIGQVEHDSGENRFWRQFHCHFWRTRHGQI